MRNPTVCDLEVYSNFVLILFKNVTTKEIVRLELPLDALDREVLVEMLTTRTIVTFNGTGYDLPLLALILRGDDSREIKRASNRIIEQNLKWWHFEKEFNVRVFPDEIDHIDLMEIAPLTGSLKLYAARMHSRSIQDLPIDHTKEVTEEDKAILRSYCENDCDSTIDLCNKLTAAIALREQMSTQYQIDLRSKSDAQIAEAVIKSECEAKLQRRLEKPIHQPGEQFRYRVPEWMQFKTIDILPMVKQSEFSLSDKGKVLLPDELKEKKIRLTHGVYRMGVGGLHSSETQQIVKADTEHVLIDVDVESYYPRILLNQKLYPKHIGPTFLDVYQSLIDRRLQAKRRAAELKKEIAKVKQMVYNLENEKKESNVS